jgi:hypothetical protein
MELWWNTINARDLLIAKAKSMFSTRKSTEYGEILFDQKILEPRVILLQNNFGPPVTAQFCVGNLFYR